MRIVELDEEARKGILEGLLKRSPNNYEKYNETVLEIVERVRTEGDQALFAYTNQFDCEGIDASNIQVTEAEIREAYDRIDPRLLETIQKALLNIRAYHEKQKQYGWFDTTPDGAESNAFAGGGGIRAGGQGGLSFFGSYEHCAGADCRGGANHHGDSLRQGWESESGGSCGGQRIRRGCDL